MSDETLLEKGRRQVEEIAAEYDYWAEMSRLDGGRCQFSPDAFRAVLAELDRLRSRVDELEARPSKEMSARASREMLNRLRKGIGLPEVAPFTAAQEEGFAVMRRNMGRRKRKP